MEAAQSPLRSNTVTNRLTQNRQTPTLERIIPFLRREKHRYLSTTETGLVAC